MRLLSGGSRMTVEVAICSTYMLKRSQHVKALSAMFRLRNWSE